MEMSCNHYYFLIKQKNSRNIKKFIIFFVLLHKHCSANMTQLRFTILEPALDELDDIGTITAEEAAVILMERLQFDELVLRDRKHLPVRGGSSGAQVEVLVPDGWYYTSYIESMYIYERK